MPLPILARSYPPLTRSRAPQEIKQSGSPSGAEAYHITATLDKTTQISVTFDRPADAPGFKYGAGPDGGFSVFGADRAEGKRDGVVVQCVAVAPSTGRLSGSRADARDAAASCPCSSHLAASWPTAR